MQANDRECRRYLKEIEGLLICNKKQKKEFMASFSDNLNEYLESNPDIDINKLKDDMGTPQEIADGFLENASSKTIKRKISFASWLKGALVVIILIYIIAIVVMVIDTHSENHGYFVEKTVQGSITEIKD